MEEVAKKAASEFLGKTAIWRGTRDNRFYYRFYFSDTNFQTGVVVTVENGSVVSVEPDWVQQATQYIYTVNSSAVTGWWRGNVGGSIDGGAIPVQETQGRMWFPWSATFADNCRTIKVNLLAEKESKQ